MAIKLRRSANELVDLYIAEEVEQISAADPESPPIRECDAWQNLVELDMSSPGKARNTLIAFIEFTREREWRLHNG